MLIFLNMKKLVIVLIFAVSATLMSAQQKWGVVNTSACYMRNSPDYESALETQALMGSVVEVLGSKGIWTLVTLQEPQYTAWVTGLNIAEMDEAGLKAYIAAPKMICTAGVTHIYSKPTPTSRYVSELILGDIVRKADDDKAILTRAGGFLKVLLPSGEEGYVRKKDVTDFDLWSRTRFPDGEKLVRTACRFLGVPYLWGGNCIKAADCSGLVWCTYFLNGIILPRNASQQAGLGEEVSIGEMQPGDLIFFGTAASDDKPARYSHVGMYIGDGKMIHSSQIVRINSLKADDPDYYDRQPLLARRVLGHVGDGSGATGLRDSRFYF